MVGGSPDYTKTMRMQGSYGGTLTTVAVDANGNIVALMKGDSGAGLVTLLTDSAGRLVSVITGDNSGTPRTVALDSGGRIIGVFRDPDSNNYMAINSNGEIQAVMYGSDVGVKRPVNVDAGGNMVAVMKGILGGQLKTLSVDTDGRMLAKLVDPDNIFGDESFVGNADLAARLGSPVVFERRGEVMYINDFSCGVAGTQLAATGTAGATALTAVRQRHGGYSMLLTSGDEITSYSRIRKGFYWGEYSGFIGFEVSIILTDQDGSTRLVVYVIYGGVTQYYELKLDHSDGKIYYWSSGAAWVDSGEAIDVIPMGNTWNTFKLVVDPDNAEYVRFYSPAGLKSLAGIGAVTSGSGANPSLLVDVIAFTDVATEPTAIYVDDLILTIDEPAT